MNVLYTNSDDPEFVDPMSLQPKWKQQARRGTTWLMACVALLCFGSGVGSVVHFIRKERSSRAGVDFSNRRVVRPFLTGAKIDREHFEQIRIGMKFEEVVDLLGGRPGSYEGIKGWAYVSPSEPRLDNGKGWHGVLSWIGFTSEINILVDKTDHVIDKEYCLIRTLN